MSEETVVQAIKHMPMIALRGLVLFPKMILHFEVGRDKSITALNEVMGTNRMIYLCAQKDIRVDDPAAKDIYSIGVVAEVKQVVKNQNGSCRVLVEGRYRAKTVEVFTDTPCFRVAVEELPLKVSRTSPAMSNALMRTVKDLFEEYCSLTPRMPKELVFNAIMSEDPVLLAEYVTGNISFEIEDKQKILELSNPVKRLETLAQMLESENNILVLERQIQDKVKEQVDKNQREYYLREQMKAISGELGEGDVQEDVFEYYEKITALRQPAEITDKLCKEADRLGKMPGSSPESGVIRTYLDTCLALPWNKRTTDKIDVVKARTLLDKEHYGMEKVKDRIIEQLAVRKLAPDMKGQILCLVGPPGVGKTSIARSIAKSMGRKYVRLSLGGVRDESDIRGHRKTYIGAMPGRIMNAMKLAQSANPLMLLDEIDKLGNDFRGDPSSALLEVLDSEQNSAFRDHYIEIPFDLSDVLFIATANSLDTIPSPLRDRMDIISLSSYTREEKFQIAKRHLAPKQLKRHGLTAKTSKIQDDALYSLIDHYTREAGVRSLERSIASLLRKAAKQIVAEESKKVVFTRDNLPSFLGVHRFRPEEIDGHDEIGVVNGLAWTSVGGEMLQIEVAVLEGSGKLELTGCLGDVMKESAHAAVSYIRSACDLYGIEKDFYKTKDIHIHVPEGAVPKDGPSAGVTICTALISALSGILVKGNVAMTGEMTLRGRVLAIGGLKEKTMAAYRAGIKTVVIPEENKADLDEIDPTVRQALQFYTADRIGTVLNIALKRPECASESSPAQTLPIPAGDCAHNTVIQQ